MNILKSILATILYIVSIELIGGWTILVELMGFQNLYEYYPLIQGILQALFIILFIQFFTKTNFRNLPQATRLNWYLLAIALGVGFIFLQTPLNWIYNSILGTEYHIIYDFNGLNKFENINILSTLIFIPFAEELFFRQYIQNNLQDHYKPLIAVGVASLMFTFIHIPYELLLFSELHSDWHLFYMAIFGGLISGYLFYKSKSIGPSFVMHLVWNAFATLI